MSVRRYCSLSAHVASKVFGYQRAADCFCGQRAVSDEFYRYDRAVSDFIAEAVEARVRDFLCGVGEGYRGEPIEAARAIGDAAGLQVLFVQAGSPLRRIDPPGGVVLVVHGRFDDGNSLAEAERRFEQQADVVASVMRQLPQGTRFLVLQRLLAQQQCLYVGADQAFDNATPGLVAELRAVLNGPDGQDLPQAAVERIGNALELHYKRLGVKNTMKCTGEE